MFRAIQKVVRGIPRGRVATYGDVARAAGYPGRARYVAWALRAAEGLPWHRVLGAGGRILLPGESGLEQKLRLRAEGVEFMGERVRLNEYRHAFNKTQRAGKTGGARGPSRNKRQG